MPYINFYKKLKYLCGIIFILINSNIKAQNIENKINPTFFKNGQIQYDSIILKDVKDRDSIIQKLYLVLEDKQKELLWSNYKGTRNENLGVITEVYLQKDTCSFIYTINYRDVDEINRLIRCIKNGNGKWEETNNIRLSYGAAKRDKTKVSSRFIDDRTFLFQFSATYPDEILFINAKTNKLEVFTSNKKPSKKRQIEYIKANVQTIEDTIFLKNAQIQSDVIFLKNKEGRDSIIQQLYLLSDSTQKDFLWSRYKGTIDTNINLGMVTSLYLYLEKNICSFIYTLDSGHFTEANFFIRCIRNRFGKWEEISNVELPYNSRKRKKSKRSKLIDDQTFLCQFFATYPDEIYFINDRTNKLEIFTSNKRPAKVYKPE